MRYFSMCSGIGGFELGIQQAIPAAQCVGYSEIDSHAITTYERHFSHDNYGDATTIDTASLPDFDVLVAGFPCQPFSIAGGRHGFAEARGTLFFDICRVLDAKKPRHFILENVKGLLSHDGGRTFRFILSTLTELGYGVEWQVLNSKDFGVPQNRERVYLVGHYGGEPRRPVFPLTGAGDDHSGRRGPGAGVVRSDTTGTVLYRETLIANTIDANYHKGLDYHSQRTGIATFITRDNRSGETVYKSTPVSNTILANYSTGLDRRSQRTAVAAHVDGLLHVRKLTPLECERLQGFPDGWTVGSNTQRYKQLGNAVTVNVVAAVAGAL